MNELFLYLDNSVQSREAESLLVNAEMAYIKQVITNPIDPKECGKPVPRLWTPVGLFDSLELIRWYVNAYKPAPF